MIKYFTIGFITLSLLYSCTSKPKNLEEYMVDISEFKINDTILKDGDYVRILGSSGNLTKDHEIDFYSLIVVKSERTRDTVNILVTNFYESDLNNSRTRFMSNSSVPGKVFENAENIEKLVKEKIVDIKPKSYNKVFYDSEYIQVDVRKYPSITGNLGDYEIVNEVVE